jgi:hypothetical protein
MKVTLKKIGSPKNTTNQAQILLVGTIRNFYTGFDYITVNQVGPKALACKYKQAGYKDSLEF